ncbi:MAG TPA: AarF/UbiB family protein [Microlunatus sp.]|nr:AarF/UbiB family protein [Microlunatus sp.]
MLSVAAVLAFLVITAAVATAGRRVLGVPVGWPRSVLVGLLMGAATAAALPWLQAKIGILNPREAGSDLVVLSIIYVLVMAWSFLLGIALLVLLELIIPTGSVGTPVGWVRGLREQHRRTRRYLDVLGIAARHGLGGFLRRSRDPEHTLAEHRGSFTARALRSALNDGGVTFIKIGQMLSSRPDIVGPTFARELSSLQTDSTPLPWSELEPVVRAALPRPVDEVFAHIDPDPLAVASVAQVHAGRLLSGDEVVLKIQKPRARAQVAADLDIATRLAQRLENSTAWAASLGLVDIVDGFAASLRDELDYRIEADNMLAVTASRGNHQGLRVPTVHTELSSSTVLVLERLDGVPLGAAGPQLAALSDDQRHELSNLLLSSVLDQVLVGGVFHSDLHPGNVLLSPSGELQLLDFGSVGRLDNASRAALTTLLLAVDRSSAMIATDALMDLLEPPERPVDQRRLEREVGELLLRYRTGSSNSSGLFTSLFGLFTQYRFRVPPQVAAGLRTLATLEGTLRVLEPSLELLPRAREQGQAIFRESQTLGSFREAIDNELLSLVPLVRRLPRRINKITEDLELGRTTLNLRVLADPRDRSFLLGVTQQIVVAILAAAATLAAVLLLVATGSPMLAPTIGLYPIMGFCLLFIGFVLALRALVLSFRREWSL